MFGRLIIVEEAESTQDLAWEMALRGEPEGTAVMALRQTRGRGRAGRSWISPDGKNLALSLLVRPRVRPQEAPLLGFIAAVAVAEALELSGVERAQLKWPNDVLVKRKKIAGILSEASIKGSTIEFAVIGIGLNVNADLTDFPSELQDSLTSLVLSTGSPCDLATVAKLFLERFGILYNRTSAEGFGFVRALWESRWANKGERVRWQGITGVAEGVLDDGSLLLRTDYGSIRHVTAGDVEPAP
jgi:BirA family biotin operon repressor/biotin-[acetyl-CoA-carboxylase] ligase